MYVCLWFLKIVLFLECLQQLMWNFLTIEFLQLSFALSQIFQYFIMKTTAFTVDTHILTAWYLPLTFYFISFNLYFFCYLSFSLNPF